MITYLIASLFLVTMPEAPRSDVLVTSSMALVTSSDALVPSSFLLLLVRHLLLEAMHLLIHHVHMLSNHISCAGTSWTQLPAVSSGQHENPSNIS